MTEALLIALVFLKKSSSRRLMRPVLSTRPGGEGESGFSRALDGLPVYSQPGGDFKEPAPDGGPPPAPAIPAPAPSSGGPVRAPTIPRAAPPVPVPGEGPAGDAAFAPVAGAAPPAAAPTPSGGPSGLPRKLPKAAAPALAGVQAPPPPPPPPPAPPPLPSVPTVGALQPPAVAERIEIEDLPAGSDMPTNVAMRNAQAPVPKADTADQVLSRLMGFEDTPPASQDVPAPTLEPEDPPAEKSEGSKITRNSDFFGS